VDKNKTASKTTMEDLIKGLNELAEKLKTEDLDYVYKSNKKEVPSELSDNEKRAQRKI